jgi:TatD DNase family protein
MKLGIGGVVTFKNGKIVLSQIDLKHIVLETDSPYLAPVPFRGKEMKVVTWLIYWISSQIYEISANDIAEITTENSKLVFGI